MARCRQVSGYIHCIAVGGSGSGLAFGYSDAVKTMVCLIEEPSSGKYVVSFAECSCHGFADLQRPLAYIREGDDTPHQLNFLERDKLLVSYFERPHFL